MDLPKGGSITVISFAHHKGGTGKTTSCLNIAGCLQKAGERVLVVDADPQANATAGLGVPPKSVRMSMYDLFMSVFDGSPRVEIEDIVVTTRSGIDLAPSNLELVGAEPYLYTIENRASVLKDALERCRKSYDFILIDTPPSMGQFVINGLVASEKTIVTFDRGVFALHGLQTLMTVFGDIEEIIGETINPEMAILTRWPEDRKHSFFSALTQAGRDRIAEQETLHGIENEVRRYFKHVFVVPYAREIYEAQLEGMPISHAAKASAAGAAYEQIAEVVRTWK